MTDKTDAWMPLWIGAYLADTQMLSTIQHGAYLLLLMAYWRERKALPDDDEALRAIAKADKGDWKKLRPALSRFFKIGNGVWWHKRVELEMAAADKRKAGAIAKAQAAAGARWKDHNADAPSNAPSIPQALPEHVLEECPTPSPIPLSSKEERTRKRVPRPEDVSEQVWDDWLQLRKAKRATVSATVVTEARAEAHKAAMPLERFLAEWCIRGSQGLKADWLRPDKTSGPQSFRAQDEAAAAEKYRRWTGQSDPLDVIDMEQTHGPLIANG